MKAIQVASATPPIAWMSIIALIRGGILFHILDFRVEICRIEKTHGAMARRYEDRNQLIYLEPLNEKFCPGAELSQAPVTLWLHFPCATGRYGLRSLP